MNEFKLIEYIKDFFKTEFIGDDAFFYRNMLISKDILIENVHFLLSDNYYEIGAKSLISNISDILAMGGKPEFFFLGLGIPEKISFENLKKFLSGVKDISNKYNVKLGGGDTSKSLNDFFISVTITGNILKYPVRRDNAKIGDLIYIIGDIGDSEIGLKIIKNEFTCENYKYFVNRHYIKDLFPEIVFELVEKKIVNSMIDISDGFIQDLEHILIKSNVSAEICVKKIPVSDEYLKLKNKLGDNFYKIALSSGEEYSVIFTADERYSNEIKKLSEKYNVRITEIGKILEKNDNLIIFKDIKLQLDKKGYIHF